MPLVSILFLVGVSILGPAIGFIIVAARARGRARTIGLIGFAVAAAVAVGEQFATNLMTAFIYSLHLITAAGGSTYFIVATLIGIIPLIILAIAISVNWGPKQAAQPSRS